MPFRSLAVLALAAAPLPLAAQATASPTAEAAGTERISALSNGEVHVKVDAALNDQRISMMVVLLNKSAQPQPFGPEAVTLTAAGKPLKVATRAALLNTGSADGYADTSRAAAGAAMPTNGAGQTDVSGFNGGMGVATAGIPSDRVDRGQRRENPELAAALDAALLKSAPVQPGKTTAGQIFTEKLKGKVKEVEIDIAFAGEHHRFAVIVPR